MSRSVLANDIIGIVPAAGQARRISPIPCSKEIYPIGYATIANEKVTLPKPVGQYLLEKFSYAKLTRALIVLRKGKWDIPQYFGNGSTMGLDLAYLIVSNLNGVPFTVDQSFSYVQNKMVAFGFPDILFAEQDAFCTLIQTQRQAKVDMVLGIFPCRTCLQADRVDVKGDGAVRQIFPRSSMAQFQSTWGIALWTFRFTKFLHDYLVAFQGSTSGEVELSMSDVIQAGIEHGLTVHGVTVSHQAFVDIGTPEGLVRVTTS